MLDSNDIQIITELLGQNRNDTRNEMTELLRQSRKETRDEMTELLTQSRKEMRDEITELLRQNRKETHDDMMAIIESEVNPKLQILAEGHEVLLEKIKRLEKQDELVDRIVILEEAVKKLNKEVSAIKKAQ